MSLVAFDGRGAGAYLLGSGLFRLGLFVQGHCTTSKAPKGGENGRRVAQHRDSGLGGISSSVVVSVFVVSACFNWG